MNAMQDVLHVLAAAASLPGVMAETAPLAGRRTISPALWQNDGIEPAPALVDAGCGATGETVAS